MSSFEEHCEASLKMFGNDYHQVHQWLDQYAGSSQYGFKHRKLRHHLSGVKEAMSIFGDDVEQAALLHIIMDLSQEGWNQDTDHFPQNQQDYINMGLY